jgi:hypothetical protein
MSTILIIKSVVDAEFGTVNVYGNVSADSVTV